MYAAHQHFDDINNFLVNICPRGKISSVCPTVKLLYYDYNRLVITKVVDAATYLDAEYYWTAYNAEKIGQLIGVALVELGDVGSIHCVG